ncbi:ascorbate peroxidase-like protein [Zea mays]|uniref:Ascorbate peroxidase-like protein n=1 Tax=Zea mays TaxID=4577 RepID=A0A1D6PD19_MAIZE|nr:ascorbate peroxidase-like protein [Zea mays]AQL07491.1 ascorbate peroxidase-like protein [Zea mays]
MLQMRRHSLMTTKRPTSSSPNWGMLMLKWSISWSGTQTAACMDSCDSG